MNPFNASTMASFNATYIDAILNSNHFDEFTPFALAIQVLNGTITINGYLRRLSYEVRNAEEFDTPIEGDSLPSWLVSPAGEFE